MANIAPGRQDNRTQSTNNHSALQKLLQKPIHELTHPSVYNKLFQENNNNAKNILNLNNRKRKEIELNDPVFTADSTVTDITDTPKASGKWRVD